MMNSLLPRVAGSKPARPAQPENRGLHKMPTYQLNVNGQRREVKVDPSTPLLWVLREDLKMTGTKFGCGISACGACTVHVNGVATRSCTLPVADAAGASITTIEGLAKDGTL